VGIHNANSWKKRKRGSPWNTLGGNSENFIRPQTPRTACALYSQRGVAVRPRCIVMTKVRTNEGDRNPK